MQVFAVSRADLETAVLAVGTDVANIRRYFERQAFDRLSTTEKPVQDRT